MLDQMREQIDQSLNLFLEKSKEVYQFHLVDPILFSSLQEFVLRKGKRIRPLLLILSYKGFRRSAARMSPSIYYVSTCIELLHNFMLIHDDIIDCSHLRRGKPTLHHVLKKAVKSDDPSRLGESLGIVAGDIVYALAIDAFLSINEDLHRKERALKYFIQTAVLTAMGEFVDTLHGFKPISEVEEKDVFLNYSLKTARYTFDCPMVVGAILAGAPESEVKKLSSLGLLVGQAFQIQDDIIGIFDTQENIGKSILSDIAESKKTLLVCHAFSHLNAAQRQTFLDIFAKPKKTFTDLLEVRKIFLQCGSFEYSMQELRNRLAQSQKILKGLRMKEKYRRLTEDCLLQLFRPSERLAEQYDIS